MEKIVIAGPTSLSGEVYVQGAKNSAMKHVLMPLLTNDKFVLHNIPDIGSTRKLLDLVILQGADVQWKENTVTIDTTSVTTPQDLPADLFYYTSGAIFLIPILVHKFGSCSVEMHPDRVDTGGDNIGTREFGKILETLTKLGVGNHQEGRWCHFTLESLDPLTYEVPVKSFSASILSLISAIFKKGRSTIKNVTEEAEFQDSILFLQQAGANIIQSNNSLTIEGGSVINGISFDNMFDRHDFITLLSAALTTESSIIIHNVNFEAMKLGSLMPFINQLGATVEFSSNTCKVPFQKNKLKPASIVAGLYPQFITEWQVLFSPLLTQLSGLSTVVETVYSDRMKHWIELGKMGAEYEYFKLADYPEVNNNPRAVKVFGPANLKGANVISSDVRAGAALIIAGMKAEGITTISGVDHIHRGYERLIERFKDLGANISYSTK